MAPPDKDVRGFLGDVVVGSEWLRSLASFVLKFTERLEKLSRPLLL